MAYGLFFTEQDKTDEQYSNIELFLDKSFYTIEDARNAYKEQLNLLSKHEKANEFQPTENQKDAFHFYVRLDNGEEVKRGFFISRVFKTAKYNLRTICEAKERAKELRLL